MIPYYTAQNFLFAELIHKIVNVNDIFYIIYPILIPLLIWAISKTLFKKPFSLIAPLIYLVSPWGWYLAYAHSLYLFLLFLTFAVIYGVILTNNDKVKLGNILIIVAGGIAMYISSIFLIFIPLILLLLLISKLVSFNQIKTSVIFLAILTFPIFININVSSFSAEVKIFEDPSLVNTANRYQGNASQDGFKNLARISENKYIFFAESLVLRYTTLLSPIAFFTPEYKLLGFSFSPPILFGFIIPFGFGLYKLLQKKETVKLLFISTVLVVPAILANEFAPLNRLILFFPIVLFIISHGINILFEAKNRSTKYLLSLTIILIIFQSLTVLNDLQHREKIRAERYFGDKYQITEP
ncbi:MAG TPA: hypothetical protein VFI61_01320 [Patescibacteria group bacterium]|nr:hypothetical protein [Patescibacteria group bacterium]